MLRFVFAPFRLPLPSALLTATLLMAGAPHANAQPAVSTGIAAFKAGDYKKALDTLELPAITGNAEAQFLMGQLREYGWGMPASRDRALFWYGQAAAQGHIAARAAQEALRGTTPESSASSAIPQTGTNAKPLVGAALRASSEGDAPRAGGPLSDADRLNAMLEGRLPYDRARAAHIAEALKPRAETGNADSAALLGLFYESGLPGAPDYAAAARWYAKAAELKHALATNNLGALHYEGRGVPRDYAEALRLYRSAAESGFAIAQYNLALMLGQGRSVEVDVPQMIDWLKKSSAQGYARAQAQLARLTLDGIGVEKDAIEAGRLFRTAAENGNANAQYWYGLMATAGNGVTRDVAIGAEWILKAAEAGLPAAMHEAGALLEQGVGRPVSLPRALAWYRKAADAGVKDAAQRLASAYKNGELGVRPNPPEAARWAALAR